MLDIANHDPNDPPPTVLDAALRAIPVRPVPESLLASCLATMPGSVEAKPRDARRRLLWAARLAAAALVLVAVVGTMGRPKQADAAGLLQAVKAAWTKVPASHQVIRMTRPDGPRTEETWVVRHKGSRKETRSAGILIGVVVRNSRWEFRWDVPGQTVAAWSTELAAAAQSPGDEGLFLDKKDFEVWAKSHRAEIVVEDVTVVGRKVQKVAVQWPGVAGTTRTDTVWFDPESLLPLRQRFESWDGTILESTIDYPALDAVANDLFSFAMPQDVVLEVNDPDLGRQLYSESQTRKADVAPPDHTKGAER
jgi:hypothetical protein